MVVENDSLPGSSAELKIEGDLAFKRQEFHAAYEAYTSALDASAVDDPEVLSNRSLTAFRLGLFQNALQDAEDAIEGMHLAATRQPLGLAKAYHRRVAALVALGYNEKIGAAVEAGLAAEGASAHLRAALLSSSSPLSTAWLAQYWTSLIIAGEQPLPLSSRDGKLLRIIAPSQCMTRETLEAQLAAAMVAHDLAADCRHMLVVAWQRGSSPGRAPLALMRAYAYLHVQEQAIALRDARVALAYGAQRDGRPSWAPAHALLAAVLEAQAHNTPAALAIQVALELRPGVPHWQESLERLMRRIPDEHAKALQGGGSARLEAVLAGEVEEATPEILRQRPKYYYYNQWMRKRIAEHCGDALPEAVVGRLLAMEAGELDLILHYPAATQQQARELLEVYETQGAEALEASKPPQLTWEQVKVLKGPNLVGLGMGGPAPGEGLAIEHEVGSKVLAIQPSPEASVPDARLAVGSAQTMDALGGQSRAASDGQEHPGASVAGNQCEGSGPASSAKGTLQPEGQPVMDLSPPASVPEGSPPGGAQVSEGQNNALTKPPPESAAERRSRLMLAASSAAEEAEAAQEPPKHGTRLADSAVEGMAQTNI